MNALKRLSILAVAAFAGLGLSACALQTGTPGTGGAVISVPAAPVAVADKTVLDEQGLRWFELAYKGLRLTAETATDAGQIRGQTAEKVRQFDIKAKRALGVARSAYKASNAANYNQALEEGRVALDELVNLLTKRS